MIRRAAAAAIVLALALGMTTACQPEPAPSASGPVFANEEEAFAAAEETYRAYVDALNQVDLSDPETFEAVYAWTTGEANAGARKSFSEMQADGWRVAGRSVVGITEPVRATIGDPTTAVIVACLDVSSVTLVDASGESVVDPNRPNVQEVLVDTVASTESATGLLINNLDGSDEGTCEPE